jgi:hypothetical protein
MRKARERETQLLDSRRRQLASSCACCACEDTQLKLRWGVSQEFADSN